MGQYTCQCCGIDTNCLCVVDPARVCPSCYTLFYRACRECGARVRTAEIERGVCPACRAKNNPVRPT